MVLPPKFGATKKTSFGAHFHTEILYKQKDDLASSQIYDKIKLSYRLFIGLPLKTLGV